MKVEVLKKIIKETVREAIQEELKEVLYESFKSGARPTFQSGSPLTPPPVQPKKPSMDPQALREQYRNVLGETAHTLNTSHVGQPLRVTSTDTTSPNSSLPEGEVSLDQVMGLMNR
jgi:hypothetical protein